MSEETTATDTTSCSASPLLDQMQESLAVLCKGLPIEEVTDGTTTSITVYR